MKHYLLFFITIFLFTPASLAKIFMDVEEDPIPIVDLTVIIPQGSVGTNIGESVAASFLDEILVSGTLSKDKQAFNDALSKYGVDYSFTLGRHYSYWSLSFPYIKESNYEPLIKLLEENWEQPRFTEKQFQLGKLKFEAAYKSSLDRDMSLLSSLMSNWIDEKEFSTPAVFLDDIQKRASLEESKLYFENRIRNSKDAWVGTITPKDSLPLVEKILNTVFHRQGSISRGERHSELASNIKPVAKISQRKTFLLIDKAGQAQTIMGVRSLSPQKTMQKDELEFFFGDFLLFSNGLDSYYANVIRTEKGLAYSVSGSSTNFRGQRLMGFTSNPQASKQEEAFSTIAELLKKTYDKGQNLEIIPEERWNRVLNGFRNMKALDNGLPDQRLSNRMGVVTGGQSYDLATSDPSDWNIRKDRVASILENHWNTSTRIVGAVGDARKLQGLAKKYFPEFELVTIPYKNAIYSSSIR